MTDEKHKPVSAEERERLQQYRKTNAPYDWGEDREIVFRLLADSAEREELATLVQNLRRSIGRIYLGEQHESLIREVVGEYMKDPEPVSWSFTVQKTRNEK